LRSAGELSLTLRDNSYIAVGHGRVGVRDHQKGTMSIRAYAPGAERPLLDLLTGGRRGGKRGKLATTGLRPEADKREDLVLLNSLLEQGVVWPVTDRVFALNQIADAHRYVQSERKAGDVVIEVQAMPQSLSGGELEQNAGAAAG